MASGSEIVLLEHGAGGEASECLLKEVFFPFFEVEPLDSVVLSLEETSLAFTTDSFVVSPIFFPGGDIGSLSVCGTINDLAMMGACPRFLAVSFILEEGLRLETLRKIVASMAQVAKETGVQIVCGDTKVVPKGKADQVFVNTTGIGTLWPQAKVHPTRIKEGDFILLSGPIAEHGLAVLSARENLGLQGIKSDSQPLHRVVRTLVEAIGTDLHALRDPTRGGLASTLNELAHLAGYSFLLFEEEIPIRPEVEAGCELLGLDPYYLACEGRLVAFVSAEKAFEALEALKGLPEANQAAIIGRVEKGPARVILKTRFGGQRLLRSLSGEPLPRIC